MQSSRVPYQPADDGLGHQSTSPRDRADSGSSVFTERFWYMGANAPKGDILFGAGLGMYPNRGVMDGFVGITLGDVQHVFRGSRRLDSDAPQTTIGPLSIQVETGMRRHRLVLAPNETGLGLDVQFFGALSPNDEGTDTLRRGDAVIHQVTRFVQFGHYVGWIDVKGKRIEITPDQPFWGARDRSWGLRVEARTDESSPPLTKFRPLFFAWTCAQFAGSGIHFFLKEEAPGKVRFLVGDEAFPLDSGLRPRAIIKVEHDLVWASDPHSQRIASGEFRLLFADGERRTLSVRALPARFYLKAGLYGGHRGWFQGDDKGLLHTEGLEWNLRDADTRRELRSLADQAFEFRDGDKLGYGTIQHGLAPGYGRYREVEHLPTM